MSLEQHRRLRELELHLGDPLDASRSSSFARSVELDELEAFPQDFCDELNNWGFQRAFVPHELGGDFRCCEELAAQVRGVARRDLTTAIGYCKTFLGSSSVWLAGEAAQKRRCAEAVLNGEAVSLALTERDHGSDLLATETEVRPVPGGGRVLTGEKWLINNATRSTVLTVLARTGRGGSPRDLSLLLIFKNRLNDGDYHCLPKIRTHGIRGADISGIRFLECPVRDGDFVGRPGEGLDILLRGFQITRTLCAALSLGAGDTALRCAVGHARTHRRYGAPVWEIPVVSRALAEAFADLLICECVALVGLRGLHAAPGRMSVWSSLVKHWIPSRTDSILHELSLAMGGRHYLREGLYAGVFQKILRDHALVGLFDGSSIINLRNIGLQLPLLAKSRGGRPEEDLAQARRWFGTDWPPGALDPARLRLSHRGRDLATSTLGAAVQESARHAAPSVGERLISEAVRVSLRLDELYSAVLDDPPADGSSRLFVLADQYCRLQAAAACLQVWAHGRDAMQDRFKDGRWLVPCLDRLAAPAVKPCAAAYEELANDLVEMVEAGRMLSLNEVSLAPPGPSAAKPTSRAGLSDRNDRREALHGR